MRRVKKICPTIVILLVVACGIRSSVVDAQDVTPPPPEQQQTDRPPREGQQTRQAPLRGGLISEMPGMFPRGDREHMDAFKQLPEEERQRLRSAFEKVWKNPDVVQARDQLRMANEKYRETLHKALGEADPGVMKILEKAKSAMPNGGLPFTGRMPDPNDPEFTKKVLTRLGEDLQKWASVEKRDLSYARLHERMLNAPAVKEFVKQLEAETEPQKRMEIAGKLRGAYLAGWRAEMGQIREGQSPREGSPTGKPERRDKPALPDEEKK